MLYNGYYLLNNLHKLMNLKRIPLETQQSLIYEKRSKYNNINTNQMLPYFFRSICWMKCFEKYRKPNALNNLEKRKTRD